MSAFEGKADASGYGNLGLLVTHSGRLEAADTGHKRLCFGARPLPAFCV